MEIGAGGCCRVGGSKEIGIVEAISKAILQITLEVSQIPNFYHSDSNFTESLKNILVKRLCLSCIGFTSICLANMFSLLDDSFGIAN